MVFLVCYTAHWVTAGIATFMCLLYTQAFLISDPSYSWAAGAGRMTKSSNTRNAQNKTGWSHRAQGQVLGIRDPHSSPQLPSQPVLPTMGADAPVPMALEFKMWYGFHTTGPLHSHQSHTSPYTCRLPGLLMEGKLAVLGLKETETLFSDCGETFCFFICLTCWILKLPLE